jgi:hypothetical protein
MDVVELSEVPDEVVKDLCVWTPANHMPVTFISPGDLTDDERRWCRRCGWTRSRVRAAMVSV